MTKLLTYQPASRTGDLEAVRWSAELVRWMKSTLMVLLGAILLIHPTGWFGPTWQAIRPGALVAFGVAALLLGVAMLAETWAGRWRAMSVLLTAAGLLVCTLATMLFTRGTRDHSGVMECLFMFYVAGHMILHAAGLRRY